MYIPKEVQMGMAIQDTFGADPAAPNLIIIPRTKQASGPRTQQSRIDNPAQYTDGFERMFGLGNKESDAELPLVPNTEFLGELFYRFCGNVTTDIQDVNGMWPHDFAAPTDEIIFSMIEAGIPGSTLWYRYYDHVISKLSFRFALNDVFQIGVSTVGSGLFAKEAATIDAAPTEITGDTLDYVDLAYDDDGGGDPGDIVECAFEITRNVVQKRPSGASSVATEIKASDLMVRGTLTVYWENDDRYADARAKTLRSLDITIPFGFKSFAMTLPELQLEPSGPRFEDQEGVKQQFAFSSIKNVSADAPFKATVTNATAAYPA